MELREYRWKTDLFGHKVKITSEVEVDKGDYTPTGYHEVYLEDGQFLEITGWTEVEKYLDDGVIDYIVHGSA